MIPTLPEDTLTDASREEILTALFNNLVIQQANIAFSLLGVPLPDGTVNPEPDVESAKIVIDQLEMLGEKTRGNLSHDEAKLLADTMAALKKVLLTKFPD